MARRRGLSLGTSSDATRDEIDAFLGHFGTDEDRQKFASAIAAALYGLEL